MSEAKPGVKSMTYRDMLVSGALKINIEKPPTTRDTREFNRNFLVNQIAQRLYDIGDAFLGTYEVKIFEIRDENVLDGFQWKAFTHGQHGIGFCVSRTSEGSTHYPGRHCTLVPPKCNFNGVAIDIDELYAELVGRPIVKKPPVLKLVEDVVPAPLPAPPPLGDTERLAKALAARKRERGRLATSVAACAALEADIAQLETELASQPSFDELVTARFEVVRTQYEL